MVLCGGLFVTCLFFPLVIIQKFYRKAPSVISAGIWADMLLIINIYMSVMQKTSASDDLPAVFFVIIVLYTMLPLPKKVSVVCGVLSMTIQILMAGLMADLNRENLVFQVRKCTLYNISWVQIIAFLRWYKYQNFPHTISYI
jgi:hypothetical protein